MQIVRTLFGDNLDFFKEEIPTQPQFNEVVYVWGKKNLEYIKQLGYKYRFVEDTNHFDFVYKLHTLNLAYKEFKEVLFLDWDVETNLTEQQIKELEFPNPCMPLYSYPNKFQFGDKKETSKQLEEYSWKLGNTNVLPNACLIYFNGFNLGSLLEEVHKEHKFDTLIEEFSFQHWVSCTLDEYIELYDCPYMYGNEESVVYLHGSLLSSEKVNTSKELIAYIGDKERLFYHNQERELVWRTEE